MRADKGAGAVPVRYLHLKSNNLTPAGSGRHHLTFVLVNKVLDALEIPVPMHRADAELMHHCGCEKQPKRSSFTQATGIFAWAKQNLVEKILLKEKLT